MGIWIVLLGLFPVWVFASEPILPLEPIATLDANKVALGRALFHDRRLSKGDQISCASCHRLALHGADVKPLSTGVNGRTGELKTPTIYNVVWNVRQAWDGRAGSLYEQVESPIENRNEHDMEWSLLVAKLNQDKTLVKKFNAIYPKGLTKHSIKDAIAAYESSLVTTDAPFDLWLQDKGYNLPEGVLAGYDLFKRYGCISCHQGRNVGGNMFAKMGTFGDYFADRGKRVTQSDFGRYNVTGKEKDKFVFKVPSLRLASKQAYFFHDASHASLEAAIATMAKYQLGRSLPASDISKIAAFIGSLAGKHKEMDVDSINEE